MMNEHPTYEPGSAGSVLLDAIQVVERARDDRTIALALGRLADVLELDPRALMQDFGRLCRGTEKRLAV
jgi:hypothetical protein